MSFGASMTILPKRLVLVLRVQLGLRKMEGDETEWLAISKCYQYPKEPHPWSEYKAGIHTLSWRSSGLQIQHHWGCGSIVLLIFGEQ